MRLVTFLIITTMWATNANAVSQGPQVDKNLFVPILTQTVVSYERMKAGEVLSMEPACLVIGMGRATGSKWGMPAGTFSASAEPRLKDYPMLYIEDTGKYAQWFHHYCWGELDRVRHYAATNPVDKEKYLKKWISAIHYSLNDAKNKRWIYTNKVRGDLAAAQLASKQYTQAVITATEVIAADPLIETTHTTLIDALLAQNKKQEAETATLEALTLFGKKKGLVRRYRTLTGKEPDIPDPVQEPIERKLSILPTPNPPVDVSPQKNQLKADPGTVKETVTSTTQIGIESNPYCRFCPVSTSKTR